MSTIIKQQGITYQHQGNYFVRKRLITVTNPNIEIGDYSMYNEFIHDPAEFERNNVLYHYPIKFPI